MPTYEFDMPDGTKKRGEGATPEAAWQSLNTAPSAASKQEPERAGDKPLKVGDAVDALHGVMQGWLDPVEGLAQLAEKTTGWHLAPQGLKDWARNYRKQAQSTIAGLGGEVAGNIASPLNLVPGYTAGRLATWAGRAALGAIGAASQPVTGGGDYWRTKGNQALTGGLIGGTLPSLAAQAGNIGQRIAHSGPYFMRAIGIPQAAGHIAQGIGAAANIPPATAGRVAGEAIGQHVEEDDNDGR